MIAYLNPLQGQELRRTVELEPIIGSRILSWFKCYGNIYPFCDLWLIYRSADLGAIGAICRYHGTLSIACNMEVDFEELAQFIPTTGAVEVECLEPIMERLLPMLSYTDLRRGVVMGLDPRQPRRKPALDKPIETEVNIAQVHSLLCSCFEHFAQEAPFSFWYVDASARFRKADCFAVSIVENSQTVSTAGVYQSCDSSALIACVATAQEYRGRGYAARCINHCLDKLAQSGKMAYLVTASDSLVDYYSTLGFERASVRCSLRLTAV